jgi:photosystem II stability/assembly factor-like uncharacterized protein
MKKIILTFLLLFASANIILAQSGWFLQNPYPLADPLMKIQAVSSSIIYAAGHGRAFIKSTNGGVNWEVLTNRIPNWNYPNQSGIYSLSFTSIQTGYICGSRGKVYKTTDGGYNWSDLPTGITTELGSIYFTSESTG